MDDIINNVILLSQEGEVINQVPVMKASMLFFFKFRLFSALHDSQGEFLVFINVNNDYLTVPFINIRDLYYEVI